MDLEDDDQEADEQARATMARHVITELVRRARPRAIVQAILATPGIDHETLAHRVGISELILTHYLKELMRRGVVHKRSEPSGPGYHVAHPDATREALARPSTQRPSGPRTPAMPRRPRAPSLSSPAELRRQTRAFRRLGPEMLERTATIMRLVEDFPGADLRHISDLASVPHPQVLLALQWLVRMDRVQVESMGPSDHYFAASQRIGNAERLLICFARQPRPRAILGTLLCTPWSGGLDVAASTGWTADSLRNHLRRMTRVGLLHVRTTGGRREYRLRQPAAAMAALARTEPGYHRAVA